MYYKLLPKQFIEYDKIISTNDNYYAKFLEKIHPDFISIFERIINIDEQIEKGIDLGLLLFNKTQLIPVDLIQYYNKQYDNQISLEEITGNNNHKGEYIEKNIVLSILNEFQQYNIGHIMNGTLFWEYIFEREREINQYSSINRLESYFVFENKEDCIRYKEDNKKQGEIVSIEPLDIKKIFKADMNFMDMIENHYTYSKIKDLIFQYWTKQSSENPIMETLFTGSFRMKKI